MLYIEEAPSGNVGYYALYRGSSLTSGNVMYMYHALAMVLSLSAQYMYVCILRTSSSSMDFAYYCKIIMTCTPFLC